MPAGRNTPLSMAICRALVRIAAVLAPAERRQDWRQEWFAELCYRERFLRETSQWNRREAWRLIRRCLGAFPDAACYIASPRNFETWMRDRARSPWLCLAAIGALLAAVALASGGFPATRELLFGPHAERSSMILLWMHPPSGGPETGLPPDVVPAWAKHSVLLDRLAAFNASHAPIPGLRQAPLVVRTEPALFAMFGVRPELGKLPNAAGAPEIVLDHRAWVSLFHSDPKLVGSFLRIGGEPYRVSAVVPQSFRFLSRQRSLYLVEHELKDPAVMVIARVKPGASRKQISRELAKIAQNSCYYFLGSDLRLEFLESAVFTPLQFFGIAVGVSILMLLALSARIRVRRLRIAWKASSRDATLRRCAFFAAKSGLALALIFTAGLEWSRQEGSFLFASKDPANGPFLVWLYILGAMGVLFWSVADQRARCRVCLRLLCFPVRIGCPGCLLLDWSGTESVCAEGHGVLHVPHLAASWDEEAEHWIALDESWRELFAEPK